MKHTSLTGEANYVLWFHKPTAVASCIPNKSKQRQFELSTKDIIKQKKNAVNKTWIQHLKL